MFPIYSVDDQRDVGSVGFEQFSDKAMRHSSGFVQRADCANVSLIKDRLVVFATDQSRAMPMLVMPILYPGHPPQVYSPVVMAVIVPMRDFMFRGWARAMKRAADHGVDIGRMAYPKVRRHVASVLGLRYPQQHPRELHRPSVPIDDCAINRAKPTKARGLIARMVGDRAPRFHNAEDIGAIRSPQDRITILAARV